MERGAHSMQLIYTATDALTTDPPPDTGRGLVNSLNSKEPATIPRQGVTAKCSRGEGDSANGEKPKRDNLASEWIGRIGIVNGTGLNCPSLPWTDTAPSAVLPSPSMDRVAFSGC